MLSLNDSQWNRVTMRGLIATIACCVMTLAGAAAVADAARRVQFDIGAQALTTALVQFSDQAGLQFTAPGGLFGEVKSTGVRGEYSTGDALGVLLEGTGFTYRFVDEGTVAITEKGAADGKAAASGSYGALRVAQAGADADGASVLSAEQSSEKNADTAGAQQDSGGATLDEIVVTAQKHAQPAIEVPMSLTALSGAQIEAAGIDSAQDLSFAVPSMSVFELTPGRQIVSIRGVASQRGTSSLTGIYLDEIPMSGLQSGDIQALDLRAIDLARVEVLKGPQGTLFGEGAAGGVVRFITKDPDLSGIGGGLSTEIYNTADGGWSEEVTGILNIPLVEDRFGVRVAAKYENRAGWIDQPSIGREDINDGDMRHVRVKALFAATEQLSVKATVEVHRNEGGASNIVNVGDRRDSNFQQAFELTAPTGYEDNYDLLNLTVHYDLGFAEFLSSTSRTENDGRFVKTQLLEDPNDPRPFLEILARSLRHEGEVTSQEFRLTSAGTGPFKWTTGVNYKDATLITSAAPSGLEAVVGAVVLEGGDYLRLEDIDDENENTFGSKSLAAFADASYKVVERLELGAGVRYLQDERESFTISTETFALTPLGKLDADRLTYRTYARYAAHEDVNLYVSVGTGFRNGGFNTFVARGAPPSFSAEKTIFYEAGAKMGLFDDRLRLNTALFYGEYEGLQEDVLIDSPVDGDPLQFTANPQDAEIRGIEWDLAWRATDQLTLQLSGDVTDTEITAIDPEGVATSPFLIGDPVNFVPKYGVSVRSDYSFNWSATMPGFVRLSYDRKGKSYHSDRVNGLLLLTQRQAEAPEIAFLNASFGGEWNGWDWSLFGRNLLDEESAITAGVTGFSVQARPRTVGIMLGKQF